MTERITTPEPDETPDGPAYEGRLLPHPEDEVVDQGAGFDMGTIMTRRAVLGVVGIGAGVSVLAACAPLSSGTTTTATATATATETASASPTATATATAEAPSGEIPEETNGPYPADGSSDVDILEDSGIVRSDITTSIGGTTAVDGVPLTMRFTLFDTANGDVPFEGAALYAWCCDAQGLYSMYSSGVEDQTFLRGVQAADANGELAFTAIIPGCYDGRWTHIHFEVYPTVDSIVDYENVIATSQLAFPADILAEVYEQDAYSGSAENLARVGSDYLDDSIFSDDSSGLQMPTFSGDSTSGYTAHLAVAIDTTTTPTTSSGGMGGGPGGTPPGQP